MGMASGLVYEKMSVRKDMDPHDYDMSGMHVCVRSGGKIYEKRISLLIVLLYVAVDLATVDVKHIGQGWKNVFYLMAYPTMVRI